MTKPPGDPPNFSSLVWAGYECAYAKTSAGKRMDLLKATRHEDYCATDYQLIKELGITTVREGLAWHQIDLGTHYDFSRFEPMMAIAQAHGIQQIWDLNHFDYPDELNPYSKEFISRFAAYAAQAIKTIRKYQTGTIFIVPFNEISFFSWIGADMGWWFPAVQNRGTELKKQLVRAAIAAMDAIWEQDTHVRFIQVDPLIRRIAKYPSTPLTRQTAKDFFAVSCEAWDMLAGKVHPELGGDLKYLDIIGINYYYYNQQWVVETRGDPPLDYPVIGWNSKHRISFASMLNKIYQRYHRPIAVSETGGWGDLRYKWWRRTLREIDEAIGRSLPIVGICAYPVIDRPDWDDDHLTNSGLWDFIADDPECQRVPHPRSISIIKKYIQAHQH